MSSDAISGSPDNDDVVEWATFDAFPQYAVSSCGLVYNTDRMQYLKPSINDNGFYRVGLMINGRQRFLYMHRLVAMAFLPNWEDGLEVRFKDGDKSNWHISNLELHTKKSRRSDDELW